MVAVSDRAEASGPRPRCASSMNRYRLRSGSRMVVSSTSQNVRPEVASVPRVRMPFLDSMFFDRKYTLRGRRRSSAKSEPMMCSML